jgi:hypothetical protein
MVFDITSVVLCNPIHWVFDYDRGSRTITDCFGNTGGGGTGIADCLGGTGTINFKATVTE